MRRPDRQLALTRATVADNQPAAVLVDLIDEAGQVVIDLGLQRRSDHPARTLTSQLVERARDLMVLPTGSLRTSSMACLPAGQHRHRS